MEYRLVPKPGGFYADCSSTRFRPTLEEDLDFLMSGDDHNNSGLWSLRNEVLIVAVDEPMEATKTA